MLMPMSLWTVLTCTLTAVEDLARCRICNHDGSIASYEDLGRRNLGGHRPCSSFVMYVCAASEPRIGIKGLEGIAVEKTRHQA